MAGNFGSVAFVRLRFSVLTLLLLFTLLAGCDTPAENPATPIASAAPVSNWYQVYFSDPTSPKAETNRGGPDERLASAIRQARMSVDIAMYNLDLWSVRDALIDAHSRGLAVRMVTESDNLDQLEIQQIKEAGIPVLGDRREGLMHNKFTIIDRQDVWTGSMNLTLASAYHNNDNLIHIHSPELAQDYLVEFDEMFVDDRFGPGSPANTPQPRLTIDGSNLEIYFSPDDGVEGRIVELIQSAQRSIRFMAFSFTSNKIADALLASAREGVQVSGVVDADQVKSNAGGEYNRLRSSGLDIRLDGNPDSMHHKVIIIDDRIVITGSYNFSANAEKNNDENVLVINNLDIARYYLQEFAKIMGQATP
jgi:phosphatidylserine/phosphatidylglycerophosphate/cardiolipin synthase-like enzyme